MPSLLDRYVFFEWLKVFAIAMAVTLGILILHDMYSTLGHLVEWGAPPKRILLYYALFLPTLVPVVLPISLLLSIIFILGSFHRNNEITAMRAAGMNVFRITRTLWFAGAVLALILLWLNAFLIPDAISQSRTLYENIRFEQELKTADDARRVGAVDQLCFNNRKDDRLWFMNSFSRATNVARGVQISILNDAGREVQSIKAREGFYDDVDGNWTFIDGRETFFDSETHRAMRSTSFDKKQFSELREKPQIMVLSMRRAKDLSLADARVLIDSIGDKSSPEALPYLVRVYSIWGSSFACVIVVAIAIPFSIAGVRTNPMVGVSKTVGLFFVYYIIDNIMTAMGGRGIISPELAMALPNAAMFAFALSLYRKAM